MRILKIEIDAFGRLRDFSLEPGPGMTLIEGENESGKSTILAFLRFAFYGFPRKGGADGEERDKRLSWLDKTAAGRLLIHWDGCDYRISRRCYLRNVGGREALCEELSVISLPDGARVELGGKTPGEYFLGLPSELYDGSLSLVQSDADRVCRSEIGEAVGELLYTGEAVFSAEAAEERLQRARRELQHVKGRGGRIAELEDALAALDGDLATAERQRAELIALHTETARRTRLIAAKRAELEALNIAAKAEEQRRLLSLFEDLAKAREQEMRCRAELERIGSQAARELPSKECVVQIGDALRQTIAAEEALERAKAEQDRLANAKFDETLLEGARSLSAHGGAAQWEEKLERKQKRGRRRLVTGGIFAALGAAAAAFAHFLPLGKPYTLWGGAALLACGVFLVLLGVGARLSRRRMIRRAGVKSPRMLRTFAEQCRREEAAQLLYAQQRALGEEGYRLATEALQAAREKLADALEPIGQRALAHSSQAVSDHLEQLARRKGEWQMLLSENTAALERAHGAVEALSRSLQGVDPEALRAELARLPDEACKADPAARSELTAALEALEREGAETLRTEAGLAAVAKDPETLARERRVLEQELEQAKGKLAALRMALEGLTEAVGQLRQELLPRLAARAGEIFRQLTGGTHGELHLQSDFVISIDEEGFLRPLAHFSAGCRDAAHLALRLALLETVCAEPLPLLFDEAFSRLDDARTAQLLLVLNAYCREDGQVILFTCHERESRLLPPDAEVRHFILKK